MGPAWARSQVGAERRLAEKRYKSGAEKRKAAAERKKAQATATRAAAPTSTGRTFADLPPAPLGDPARGVAWFNELLLVCADMVIRDQVLTFEQKLKYLLDCAAKAGLIRDKAAEQAKIRQIFDEKKKDGERKANLTKVDPAAAPPPIEKP